uniref:Secreted protein n=1 Tax=Steinernema glaseri TaxID=37863 RepID=A0A1I7Z1B0_9BILA
MSLLCLANEIILLVLFSFVFPPLTIAASFVYVCPPLGGRASGDSAGYASSLPFSLPLSTQSHCRCVARLLREQIVVVISETARVHRSG